MITAMTARVIWRAIRSSLKSRISRMRDHTRPCLVRGKLSEHTDRNSAGINARTNIAGNLMSRVMQANSRKHGCVLTRSISIVRNCVNADTRNDGENMTVSVVSDSGSSVSAALNYARPR